MTVIQFQTSCLRLFFMSGIPRNSERDRSVHLDGLRTLLCRSIRTHLLTLFFCFLPIIKRQQKLSSFFTKKRMSVESERHEDVH